MRLCWEEWVTLFFQNSVNFVHYSFEKLHYWCCVHIFIHYAFHFLNYLFGFQHYWCTQLLHRRLIHYATFCVHLCYCFFTLKLYSISELMLVEVVFIFWALFIYFYALFSWITSFYMLLQILKNYSDNWKVVAAIGKLYALLNTLSALFSSLSALVG